MSHLDKLLDLVVIPDSTLPGRLLLTQVDLDDCKAPSPHMSMVSQVFCRQCQSVVLRRVGLFSSLTDP